LKDKDARHPAPAGDIPPTAQQAVYRFVNKRLRLQAVLKSTERVGID
jgi:hypothetical protein